MFSSAVSTSGARQGKAVLPQGPAFTLKAGLVPRPGLPFAVDSQMPPPPGTPRVHSSSEAEPGPGIPGRERGEATSGRYVAPLLLAHTPGHPLVTSGAGPPADNCSDECPEMRASDILRFKVGKWIKTRTTQSAVSCTTHFLALNAHLRKSKRYKIVLVVVIGICPVLGPIWFPKPALKIRSVFISFFQDF